MLFPDYKLIPMGESAIMIDFGNETDEALNSRVIGLSDMISSTGFKGFVECVPAYSSIAVFYDPSSLASEAQSAFAAVSEIIREFAAVEPESRREEQRTFDIPVDFSSSNAPDLEFVASHNGLEPEHVIDIFTSRVYRVFMLGFLPGFPYLGTIDERIAAPRLETPRISVPRGSVGIAGRQTGIYPLQSPGGWRLIGRTETDLFTPYGDLPTLLSPGDRVRFLRV
ncbi:MAG: 5-oxoprolinase subunit PxpB [Acidobacteriota bacterium]|nr:5-oxoprolinase subunit PxpB [Acidobacteriota bacterium]